MNSAQLAVLAVGLVALGCTVSSLWENPRDGRSPRQRRGGIFHRLRCGLLRSWRLFALRFFSVYCRVVGFMFRFGVPACLVNLTRLFVPDVLMRAGARAYQDEQQERERLRAYDHRRASQQIEGERGKP